MPTDTKTEIVIFKTADEKISVDVRFEGETVYSKIYVGVFKHRIPIIFHTYTPNFPIHQRIVRKI